MTKLTLVGDYCYTEQPRDYSYYVYYKLQDVLYTDTLDINTREADKIVDYIIAHYNKMMYTLAEDTKPILIVEDVIEEDTLAEAVVLLKEAARKAMLSAIQESELIQKVCGWAGQGSHQQDPALPQGYQGRTVISYPYTPALPDNLWHYRAHDIGSTPYTTEVCGIRVALVIDKRGYPVHTYDYNNSFQNSNSLYYSTLGRLGCTAEEASQAIRRVSNAMYASSHAEGQYSQAMSHAEGKGTVATWQGTPLYEKEKEEDSLFIKRTVYSIDTPKGKPVRVVYERKDTDTQQHNDTHTQQEDTHTQQEDTTHVYNVEDTHYYTQTDSVIDTHTLTYNDVVYDTQEIDSYIHSMLDIH